MMYFIRVLFIALFTYTLFGCGMLTGKDEPGYLNAKSIKPIEMPPGLVLANARDDLVIPPQSTDKSLSVDQLELPPEIITRVDLKELDDNSNRNKSASKPSEEDSHSHPAEDSHPIEEKTAVTEIEAIKIIPVKLLMTKNEDGNSLLLSEDEFDVVWPLVKPALEELGFQIDDNSRGNQMYTVSKDLPTFTAFEKAPHPGDEKPKVKEEYQIHVKPAEGKTQITVHNKFGQLDGSGLADHLLLQIKEIMEKPKNSTVNNG